MNDTYFLFDFPPSVPFQVQLTQITDIHKHWHPTVELIFVLKGTATVQVLGETSRLRAGDLLLVNSNHIHELSSQDNCPALIVHLDLHKFDLSLTDADQLYFLCNSSKDEDKGRYDDLRSLIALMVERNTAQPQDAAALYDNKSFAYSMLKELTQKFQVSRTDFTGAQDKYLERMNEIVRYIDEHYREDLSLVQLANAVHLSPPYLSSLFSRYLDTTFSDYYNSVRLSHAVSDLTSTDDPIDTLEWHQKLAADDTFHTAVLPAWRPDKAMNLEKSDYIDYLARLSAVSGVTIDSFSSLKEALRKRMDHFAQNRCCLSDHALNYVMYAPRIQGRGRSDLPQTPRGGCCDRARAGHIQDRIHVLRGA